MSDGEASQRDAHEEDPLLELDIDESETEEDAASVGSEENDSEMQSLSEESDSEIDIDVESKKPGELGNLAQKAKALRSELQRIQSSEEESEAEEPGEGRLGWGSRQQFYGTIEAEGKEDEREDLEETLELQRAELEQLQDADFDLPHPQKLASVNASETETVAVREGDADNLATLYADLRQSLNETRFKIGPLLEEAKKGDLCTEQGLLYLELEGHSTKDHPVRRRLVEIRAYLEKLRPMEARLQPQVEKLLRAVAVARDAVEEPEEERLAPHPEDLVPKVQSAEGAYRPPKMNPVSMEDADQPKKRRNRGKTRTAAEDAMVSEIVRELTGAPEEVSSGLGPVQRIKSILAERCAAERSEPEQETYVRSVPEKGVKKRMAKERLGALGGVSFSELADDIQSTVDAIEASNLTHRLPVSAEKLPVPSGDADVPYRAPRLPERVPLAAPSDSDLEEEPVAKKAKTKEQRTSLPPRAPKTTKGRRAISEVIQKNRGLVPNRARERKNPRRRHRLQFEDKEKRRKGQMRQAFSQAPDRYGGESSGISKRVKKSVRFA